MKFVKTLVGFSIAMLFVLLLLLCIPVINIPVPRVVRQNTILRRFFAWECAETFETKFDETALRDYLQYRDSHRQID